MINLIIGAVCGILGGMNLVVGNTIIGIINMVLSFGNFFMGITLIKKEKEKRNYVSDAIIFNSLTKKGENYGKNETKDVFGLGSNEDWLAQLCKQSKGSGR